MVDVVGISSHDNRILIFMDSSSFVSLRKVGSYILAPAAVVQIHKHEPGQAWKSRQGTPRVSETDQSIFSL